MFEKVKVEGASNKQVGEVKPNSKKSAEEQEKIEKSKTAEQIQQYFKKSKEHKKTLEQLRFEEKVDYILKNSQDIPKAKMDELKKLDANHDLQKQINESKEEVKRQNQRDEQKKIIKFSPAQDKVEQTDSTLNQKDVP